MICLLLEQQNFNLARKHYCTSSRTPTGQHTDMQMAYYKTTSKHTSAVQRDGVRRHTTKSFAMFNSGAIAFDSASEKEWSKIVYCELCTHSDPAVYNGTNKMRVFADTQLVSPTLLTPSVSLTSYLSRSPNTFRPYASAR